MTGGLKNLVVSIDISSPRLVMATDRWNFVSVEETYCSGVKKGKITDGRVLASSVQGLLEKLIGGTRIKIQCAGLAVTNVSSSETPMVPGQLNEQLKRIFIGVGIKPRLILPTIQASARVVLSEAEKQLGVVLVEIGDSSTSVAIFNYGYLQKAEVFPVGESHIVADLAVGLGVSLEEAEKIKSNCTELCPTALQHRAKFVIESRLEEILNIVKKYLSLVMGDWLPPGGIVLTGVGAGLPDIAYFAREKITPIPARVGVTAVPGVPDRPGYAAVLGLLQIHRDTLRLRNNRY